MERSETWHSGAELVASGGGGPVVVSVLKSKVAKVYVRATWPPGLWQSNDMLTQQACHCKDDLNLVPLSWGGPAPPLGRVHSLTALIRLS